MAERISKRIIEDAVKEAELILRSAKEEAKKMIEEQRKRAVEDATKEISILVKRAKEEAEALKRKILSEADIKVKWMIIEEKRRIIDEVLKAALARMEEYARSKSEYVEYLKRTIVRAGVILGGGDLRILLNKRDSKLNLDLEELARAIEMETGVRTTLSISDTNISTVGGFILESADGKRRLDSTFEGLLRTRARQLQIELAKILFR